MHVFICMRKIETINKNGIIFKFYDDPKSLNASKKIADDNFPLSGIPFDYEPKRKNRFAVNFPDIFSIPSFTVKNIQRPIYNHGAWDHMFIQFHDMVMPSTSHGIMNMVRHCSLNINNVLFTFDIQSLDPTGACVERWDIEVQELIRIDFGDLSSESDELSTCSVELKPYNCSLH